VFADWLRGFGMMVILDHGGGYMSLYGHNQSLLREPGEWVAAGDPVATVGDSGGHASTGVYFEIRHDGHPQDPSRWCSVRARFRAAL
jgi:septal ring factor EnvC (AmiA/AmiB activator)